MTNFRKFIRFFVFLWVAGTPIPVAVTCQVRTFPYVESFDAASPPGLPGGWQSSRIRVPGTDDFSLSASSPSSAPNCLYALNATIPQWIASPVFDLTARGGGSIRWNIRRSSSFSASLVLEGSLDGGASYPVRVGDTIRVGDPGAYLPMDRAVPAACAGGALVRFRWRVIPDAQGSAGTLRIDDCAFVPDAGSGAKERVRLDEIMYAPVSGEPEWVEIVNADSQTVNLKGWSVSDATVSSRHPIAAADAFLGPGERCVLTKDSAALAEFRFSPGWRVRSVAGFPSLNNGGDALVVFREDGSAADSLWYRPAWGGASAGSSLERWDTWGPSTDSANWGTCVDPGGATPGRMNSIARRNRDVAIGAGDAAVTQDGSVILRAHVINRGRESAPHLRVAFFRGIRRGGRVFPAGLIGVGSADGQLAPLDSLIVRVSWDRPPAGDEPVLAVADEEGEERRDNDTAAFFSRVPAVPGSVVVNEILFAPLQGEPEYVELVNAGDRPVNIGGWSLHDREAGGKAGAGSLLPEDEFLLPPGSFAVLAGDSGICRFFPGLQQAGVLVVPGRGLVSLNNDGDDVVLRDPSGATIDSVAYSPSWHSPAVVDATGRSLERRLTGGGSRDPGNWSTCTFSVGGTPGRPNSIAVSSGRPGGTVSCAPNPFSPDGDGAEDATVIHCVLPGGSWSLTIEIYDAKGRMIRRLASAMPGEGDVEVLWDGRDDLRRKARVGLYAVVMDAWDLVRGTNARGRAVVVLAGRL